MLFCVFKQTAVPIDAREKGGWGVGGGGRVGEGGGGEGGVDCPWGVEGGWEGMELLGTLSGLSVSSLTCLTTAHLSGSVESPVGVWP